MVQPDASPLYTAIYSLVRCIPTGQVTTYGRIAAQVGCTARTVGFAMAALPAENDVPWQRVINSQGKISSRTDGEGNLLQRSLLENEEIQFNQNGRIELKKYLWEGEQSEQEQLEQIRDKHF